MIFEKFGIYAYAIIFFIIFAESGLFFGFFLPGDSLLFTAGFLASQHLLDIRVLAILCFIAAVSGDSVGYAFGRKFGRRLFHRKDSILFSQHNLQSAEVFYEKHGKKTIVLARFIPVIRTFAPIVAGIGDMHYQTFIFYNIIGGLIWAVGITMLGFFLGQFIPADTMDKYLLLIIMIIVAISVLPAVWHILKEENHRKEIMKMLKKPFSR
jgi:membrane-associated protein